MTESTSSPAAVDEDKATGLSWPKTWNGAYAVVLTHFVFWIVLLLALGELCR